jgi:hypothetical protein
MEIEKKIEIRSLVIVLKADIPSWKDGRKSEIISARAHLSQLQNTFALQEYSQCTPKPWETTINAPP